MNDTAAVGAPTATFTGTQTATHTASKSEQAYAAGGTRQG